MAGNDLPLCTLGSREPSGLVNTSINCYVNTFLQCIGHTDPLRQYILSTTSSEAINFEGDAADKGPDGKPDWSACNLTQTFHVLISQIWSGRYTRLWPEPLKRAVAEYQKVHPPGPAGVLFDDKHQQDMEEFLTKMLDVFTLATNRRRSLRAHLPYDAPNTILYHVHHHRLKLDSIYSDLFHFFSADKITCKTCQHVRFSGFAVSHVLQVHLPDKASGITFCMLDDLLKAYYDEEAPDEPLACAKCKAQWKTGMGMDKWTREFYKKRKEDYGKTPWKKLYRKPTLRQKRLVDIGPILIIQLVRFLFGGEAAKNDIKVDFPLKGLDIGPYLTEEEDPIDRLVPNDRPTLYDLYAVGNQTGDLKGGHYFAYAKPSHGSKDIGWRELNDTTITNIKKKDVVTENAYMLFYRRRDSGQTIPITEHVLKEEQTIGRETPKAAKLREEREAEQRERAESDLSWHSDHFDQSTEAPVDQTVTTQTTEDSGATRPTEADKKPVTKKSALPKKKEKLD